MSSIYAPSNNPVRKIPIIHRVLGFAARDVEHAEKLAANTCFDWRESIEVYGKSLFAMFAERDPKDYFDSLYRLLDDQLLRAPMTAQNKRNCAWLVANMIGGWNDNCYVILARIKEQEKKNNTTTMLAGDAEEENDDDENKKDANDGYEEADFFTNRFMAKVAKSQGSPISCVAARCDHYEVLRVLHEGGFDLDAARDAFRKNAWQHALEKVNVRSLIEMCEIRAERQGSCTKREDRVGAINTAEKEKEKKAKEAAEAEAKKKKQQEQEAKEAKDNNNSENKNKKKKVLTKRQQQQLEEKEKFKHILSNLPPLPKVVSPDAIAQGVDDDENDMSRKIAQGIRNNREERNREGEDETSIMAQMLKDFPKVSDISGRFLSKAITYDLRQHLGGKKGRREYRQVLKFLGMMLTDEAKNDLRSDSEEDEDAKNQSSSPLLNEKAIQNLIRKIYCFCRFPLYIHTKELKEFHLHKMSNRIATNEEEEAAALYLSGHKKLKVTEADLTVELVDVPSSEYEGEDEEDYVDSSDEEREGGDEEEGEHDDNEDYYDEDDDDDNDNNHWETDSSSD